MTAKAWEQGEISASAAHEICSGMPTGFEDDYAAVEDELVDFAAARDWRGLRSLIDRCRRCAEAIRDRDREPSDRNTLHHSKTGGRWFLSGNSDDLTGSYIDRAIELATDPPLGDDDHRTPAKRRSDAMTRICRFFLEHEKLPLTGGERPHLNIDYDWASILAMIPGLNRGGPTATPAQVAELLCNCKISRIILGPDGLPLAVGRTERFATAAQRRAIAVRDQGCRFPGCDQPVSRTNAHHIPPWHPEQPGDPPGRTDIDAMLPLCDFHHGVVHRPGWSETFDGVTYTVTRPDGTTVGSTSAIAVQRASRHHADWFRK